MLSDQFFYHAQNILLMICQPMPECFWNHFRQSINHVPGARSREIVNILRGNFTSFDLELWGIGSWPATDPVCILENAPYDFLNDQITVVFPASVRETWWCAIIALNILSGFFLSTAWENSSVEAWEFQSTLPHGE